MLGFEVFQHSFRQGGDSVSWPVLRLEKGRRWDDGKGVRLRVDRAVTATTDKPILTLLEDTDVGNRLVVGLTVAELRDEHYIA